MIVRDASPGGRHGQRPTEVPAVTVADLLARGAAPNIPLQRQGPSESPPPSSSRHRRTPRRPLALAAVGLVAAGGAAVGVWHVTSDTAPTALRLTAPEVALGGSYMATASGFTAGEPVRLSWTGPTTGEMGTVVADGSGGVTHGPVIERDPPGDYRIIATGTRSGHVAVTGLRVTPAAPPPPRGR